MKAKLIFLATLAALFAFALAGPGTAAARDDGEVEIELLSAAPDDTSSQARYRGRLRPANRNDDDDKDCLKGREIELYHDGILIGTGTTDRKGRFKIDAPIPPSGDKVKAKVIATDDCDGDSTKESIDELIAGD